MAGCASTFDDASASRRCCQARRLRPLCYSFISLASLQPRANITLQNSFQAWSVGKNQLIVTPNRYFVSTNPVLECEMA